MLAPILAACFSASAASTSVAVLELESGPGVDADVARPLTARVAELVARRPSTTVIAPDDIRAVLREAQQRQLLGCTEDGCLAEIAGALGADVVVSGRIARLEDAWTVSLTAVDAVEVRSLGRATETWGGASVGLLELLTPMVATLFAEAPGPRAGALELSGAEVGSEVLVDGRARGTTPLDVIRAVPAGGRRVQVTKDGFRPFESWVVVSPGARVRVVVSQEARPEAPVYAKWWFWAALGAVAAGGAASAALLANGGDARGDPTTGVQVGVNFDDAVMGGR